MKQTVFYSLLLTFLLTACGNSEAESDATGAEAFIPVLAYLQGQVAHIDSSLYTLVRINSNNGVEDTTYIRREEFKDAAQPFTTLPDITAPKLRKKYNESQLYDGTLDRFIFTYTPKDPDEALEILRQDVVITPNTGDGDKVESIYIERQLSAGDSTVQMKMSWEVTKGFTIRTIVQKEAAPEKVQTTEVLWVTPHSAAKL